MQVDNQQKTAVSENTMNRLRKKFGPVLAAQIERWALGTDCLEATTWLLSKEGLPEPIGYMIDVFARRELAHDERETAVDRITVLATC